MSLVQQIKTRLQENKHLNYFYLKTAIYVITAIILAIAIPLTIHFSNFEDQEENQDYAD